MIAGFVPVHVTCDRLVSSIEVQSPLDVVPAVAFLAGEDGEDTASLENGLVTFRRPPGGVGAHEVPLVYAEDAAGSVQYVS